MTKMRWAAMGLMFFGAYVLQAFGCSSSPAPAATSGGACCSCTVSDLGTGCSNSKPFKTPGMVTDCTSFCAGKAADLQTCPGAAAPMITGTGVACPASLGGDEAGVVVTVDGAVVHPPGEGGAVSNGSFGAPCKADAECGSGLICIKATDDIVAGTPGGYPNGLCTADCSTDATACAPFGGLCVNFDDPNAVSPKRICLELCTLGTPAADEVKCSNRLDEACGAVSSTRFACQPVCGNDADCGGRKCSAAGMCVDMPRTGLPLGSACNAHATVPECAGVLCAAIETGSSQGFCSGVCVLGALETCDWRRTAADAGGPLGACWAALDKDGGGGDFGFCLPLCDGDSDCPKTPGTTWVCDHTIPGVDKTLNHGACQILPPDASAPTADGGGL